MKAVNNWIVGASTLQDLVTMPAISPYYNPFAAMGFDEFREMLERRVDFGGIQVREEETTPVLLVGAVDVLSREFKA